MQQPHVQDHPRIGIVGAGLAGSDCAWILAEKYKIHVILYEMKPGRMTPAQINPESFAELVCSNSLKSTSLLNPAGLLKEEMIALNSLICEQAYQFPVPAGEALAVDREKFSNGVTTKLRNHPLICVKEAIVKNIEETIESDKLDLIVVATGPLTSDELALDLKKLTDSSREGSLYFYDAIAPILDGNSIDQEIAFFANRESFKERRKNHTPPDQTKGEERSEQSEPGDYLNIPLNKDEYLSFVAQLLDGPKVAHHQFEEPKYFNGCQPIENLAESGPLTLAHGPMKGRGLTNPRTGRWPYAAVQLRREKMGDDTYNMVGFQTRLTWTAQREIFKSLPGMKDAEFHRMGSMHRNTYLCSPEILNRKFTLKTHSKIALAGQIMGVEGYLESAAMGCFLGHFFGMFFSGRELKLPPKTTALGCLSHYVLECEPKTFSPMNIHWGLFDPLLPQDIPASTPNIRHSNIGSLKIDKGTKRNLLSLRAQRDFSSWFGEHF